MSHLSRQRKIHDNVVSPVGHRHTVININLPNKTPNKGNQCNIMLETISTPDRIPRYDIQVTWQCEHLESCSLITEPFCQYESLGLTSVDLPISRPLTFLPMQGSTGLIRRVRQSQQDTFSSHRVFRKLLLIQIKQRRAWLLLGWVTTKRYCPCKQSACSTVSGGLEVTFMTLVPRLSVREGLLALHSPGKIKHLTLHS
ncbi:hypothetical protein J6590_046969 [Homalodisca vitripennis]|nr:hypothetical protein J6590_046969 [Homalodisca vitripennis]